MPIFILLKMCINRFIFILFFTCFIAISKTDSNIRRSIRTHPCNNTEAIVEVFEKKRIPDNVNTYHLFIDLSKYKDGFGIPVNSKIHLKFDSDADVSLDSNVGRITPLDELNFLIEIDKKKRGWIRTTVRAKFYNPVPNILSIRLNGDELCPYGVKKGIWVDYMVSQIIHPRSDLRDDKCGERKINSIELITNGLSTKRGDWPWHAALYKADQATQKYICGGTLINPSCIVTAGHCVQENGNKVNAIRLFAVLGKYNLQGGDSGTQEIQAYKIVLHPDYESQMVTNDIALVKLSTEVKYGTYVQPICLWKKGNIDQAQIYERFGSVVGWGFTHNRVLSQQMMSASMPVVPREKCLKSNANFFTLYLSDKNFCAGFRNGTSVCNGDSGGGMYFSEEKNGTTIWSLRGIVSLSVSKAGVCDPNQYVLFTDVARYLDWIEKNW